MERKKDLDFAKGIGIILMVLGHCYSTGNGELIRTWFYSFHMPLFFIIPGIVYGIQLRNPANRFCQIVTRKAKQLLIPYFFFATATAAALCIIGRKNLTDFGSYMYRIVTLQGINAMWFLPCFLFSELIFWAFIRSKNAKTNCFLLASVGILAAFFPILKQILPMLQTTIIGSAFIALGFLCSKVYSTPIRPISWAVCAVIHLVLSFINQYVDLAYGIYGNTILYFVNGLLGTYVLIQSFAFLGQHPASRWFVWLGRNTMVVLCTSSFVIEMLRLLDYKLTNSALSSLGFAEGILLCLLTMLTEIIVILFCNKYLWFVLGKSRSQQVS